MRDYRTILGAVRNDKIQLSDFRFLAPDPNYNVSGQSAYVYLSEDRSIMLGVRRTYLQSIQAVMKIDVFDAIFDSDWRNIVDDKGCDDKVFLDTVKKLILRTQ